jgi:multidrug efflux pump
MAHFTDIFIRRPVLAIVVSLLIFLIGMRAFMELQLRQYPMMTNTVITITTSYPGAPPDLIQGFITTPIEQAVSSIEGLDYVTSSSIQSTSKVSVYVKLNYSPGQAMTDVMAKVQQVKYQLPKEATDPVIIRTTGERFGTMFLNAYSDTIPRSIMYDYVNREIVPLMAAIPGVGEVQVIGATPPAMRIWLDPDRMAARNVNADDVANAIRANNFQSAPGETKGFFVVSSITADTGLTDVDQFADMVVKSRDGAVVRLKDIADVKLGSESYRSVGLANGKPGINISLMLAPSGNPITISEDAKRMIPDIERAMPHGMKMSVVWDTSDFINAALKQVTKTLLEAVVIVVIVIYLFLGSLRAVLIPIVTMPLSLVGAGVVMLSLGFSLNLLTLLALVLAIGLVVDDAIVVMENVHRRIELGETPFEAAIAGGREIMGPVIAMAITLAAVYAPIGFLSGITGLLFREFAFTLAAAVVVSGVVALTLTPMMSSKMLRDTATDSKFAHKVDAAFERLATRYSELLSRALNYRAAMGVFIAAVFVAVGMMFMYAPREMAPPDDQGIVLFTIRAPQTANLEYTEHYFQEADNILANLPESRARVGFLGTHNGPNYGMIAARLKPWNERKRTSQELVSLVQAQGSKVEGAFLFAFTFPPLPGNTGLMPVTYVLSSSDSYEELYRVMEGLKTKARASGLFQVVDSDLAFSNPVVRLKIDRMKAHDLGISMQAIGNTLATMVGENYTNRFSLEGRSYEVITQVPRALRLSPEALTQLYVRTASGNEIPLSTIVSFTNQVEPNDLTRFNQLNAATFTAVPAIGVSMGQAVDFLKAQSELLPKNVHTAFLSESRQFTQEGNRLLVTFLFALVIIYLVLAAQYESLRDPLVILISVPMSVCGAMLPMFFGITTMNIYTQIGLVTLIGLISKHGILMVSFARTMQIDEQCDRRTAIEHAARVRLRPILMTTAAMVAGLTPLIISTGAGAESRFALGVVVVAGMSVGTLFTLFVLPMVYTVMATDHRAKAAAPATLATLQSTTELAE